MPTDVSRHCTGESLSVFPQSSAKCYIHLYVSVYQHGYGQSQLLKTRWTSSASYLSPQQHCCSSSTVCCNIHSFSGYIVWTACLSTGVMKRNHLFEQFAAFAAVITLGGLTFADIKKGCLKFHISWTNYSHKVPRPGYSKLWQSAVDIRNSDWEQETSGVWHSATYRVFHDLWTLLQEVIS
jgi:hypothetical protein